jgi:hypothetical protein
MSVEHISTQNVSYSHDNEDDAGIAAATDGCVKNLGCRIIPS